MVANDLLERYAQSVSETTTNEVMYVYAYAPLLKVFADP